MICENEKIVKSLRYLLMNSPFLGLMSNYCKYSIRDNLLFHSAATDCIDRIFFDPKFLEENNIKQIATTILHEMLHIIEMDHFRRERRIKSIWNIACDIVINNYINRLGTTFEIGKNWITDSRFTTESKEEVYNKLLEEASEVNSGGYRTSDDHTTWGQSDSSTPVNNEKLERDWARRIKQIGESVTEHDRGTLPAGILRKLEGMFVTKTDWRLILANFFTKITEDEWSFTTFDRRFIYEGIYYPSLYDEAVCDLILCVDTSGSIDSNDLNLFISEIITNVRVTKAKISVYSCDTELHFTGNYDINNIEDLKTASFIGGGGTSFYPIFDKIKDENIECDALLYFTDLDGGFPNFTPTYTTLWVVRKNCYHKTVPFGELLRLDN